MTSKGEGVGMKCRSEDEKEVYTKGRRGRITKSKVAVLMGSQPYPPLNPFEGPFLAGLESAPKPSMLEVGQRQSVDVTRRRFLSLQACRFNTKPAGKAQQSAASAWPRQPVDS